MSDQAPQGTQSELAEADSAGMGSPTTAVSAVTAGVPSGRDASLWSDAWRQLRRNPFFIVSSLLILVFIVMAIKPDLFTSADPRACNLRDSLLRPSSAHRFGTDLQGCDYLARTIYGARVSISIGLLVTFGSVVVAVLLGGLAGYYGGLTDSLIARVTDVWFAIPTILGAIVFLSVAESMDVLPDIVQERGIWTVGLALIVLGWPTIMRLMRSSVLSIKEMDYVAAARSLGASDARILWRHILPNAMAPVIVYATITVGIIIAAESALSFIGVGLQLPAISWGLMISGAQNRILRAPHLLLFPGLFLSAAVFSFILMGDALRDALDPKLR